MKCSRRKRNKIYNLKKKKLKKFIYKNCEETLAELSLSELNPEEGPEQSELSDIPDIQFQVSYKRPVDQEYSL